MGRLISLAAGLLLDLFAAAPVRANQIDLWADHIAEASARFGIPQAWIRRVMAAESGGRTMLNGRPIRSHAGAVGLMQLMPGTWQAMRAAYGLGADPHAPRDNIIAGTAYLRLMYSRFGYPGLFAAYNAGPGVYASYLSGARRLPAETIAYVAQVARPGAAGIGAARAAPVLAAARTATVTRGAGPAEIEAPTMFAIQTESGSPSSMVAAEVPARPPRAGASLFIPLRTDRH